MEPNSYRIGVEPQLRLSDGSGGNLGVFVDSALSEGWSWRGQLGTGDTDFWAGASAKWIPIPDFEQQPAIGVRLEVDLGREGTESFTVFRAIPMLSKGFDSEVGKLTPYVAIPFGIMATKGNSETISQLVFGSEATFEQSQGFVYTAEVGFKMSKSFSYLSGTVSYLF